MGSKVGISFCWQLIEEDDLETIRQTGLTDEMLRGEAQDVFKYIYAFFRDHGQMPLRDTILDDIEVHPDLDFDPPEPCLYYAKRVVDNAAIKSQREHFKEMGEAIRDRDPLEVFEKARDIVKEGVFDYHMGQGRLVNLRVAGNEEWERYLVREAADDGILGIRSPWDRLDQETGGFGPGDLTTIVARLGVGKSWLLIMMACKAAAQGYSVGFISLEMEEEYIQLRRRALKNQLPYKDLKRGELDSEARERLKEELLADPLDDDPNWYIASGGRVTTVAEAEMFVEETQIDALFVDGVYLMNEGGKNTPTHERTMLAIRGIKRLGQKKKIPTFATAQFNRTVKKGSMQAGSESIGHSDAIGQDSNNVIGMFRDKDTREANQMFLSMLKVREGVPIEMTINWDFVTMAFNTVAVGVLGDEDDDEDDGNAGVMW